MLLLKFEKVLDTLSQLIKDTLFKRIDFEFK